MISFWLVMGVLVAALLWVHKTERWRAEWIVKPAAALTFVAAGIHAGGLETPWGQVLTSGLVLAAVGDVFLIPKNRRAFLFGLVSFLLGHVAYAVAFGVRGVNLAWMGGAALILFVLAIPILRWLWPNVDAPMRIPVAAYIVVITAMVALAAGTVGAHGDVWILVGAFGFYLSDLSVAKDRFVGGSFANRMWGLPLYFFSQLLLASRVGA